jgi:hypothetical protein
LLGVKADDPDFMPSLNNRPAAAAAAALNRPVIHGARVAQPAVLVEPRVRRTASWCTFLWEKLM